MKRTFAVTTYVEVESDAVFEGINEAKKLFEKFGLKAHEVKHIKNSRTLKQNSAMHLYFTQLAEELNNAGTPLNEIWTMDIPATPILIKETLWKKVQKAMFDTKSTTQLTTTDIDKIYDVINKVVGEKTGIFLPFPSIETLNENSKTKR